MKLGLSRFCDDYKVLPYWERVKFENSLNDLECDFLDHLNEKKHPLSLSEINKFNKKINIYSLIERDLIEKNNGKYFLTKKGREVQKTIMETKNGRAISRS